MNGRTKFYKTIIYFLLTGTLFWSVACTKSDTSSTHWIPGYLETDLMEIASPESGYLKKLWVRRGQMVKAQEPLFELAAEELRLGLEDAKVFSEASAARLEDSRQGLRPDEIAALTAELEEAKASLKLATINVERLRTLANKGVSPQADLDQSESAFSQAWQAVLLLEARIRVGKVGARDFQQKAMEKEFASAQLKE